MYSLDERLGGLFDFVGAIVDRDRLQQHRAVRGQELRALGKEPADLLPADRLDHLDRDQLVVGTGQVAVVVHEHGDPVAKAGPPDALHRVIVLLARDRGGGDLATTRGGGVEGEPTPGGPDLEHMVTGPELELLADPLELGHGGLLEGHALLLEEGAGVHHRRVQHAREELIADVVVVGYVAPASLAGAAVQRRADALAGGPERGGDRAHAVDQKGVAGGQPDHGDQIG